MRLIKVLLYAAVLSRAGDFVSGSANCPSSGAAQISTTPYNLYQLTVSAPAANAGTIYVGGSAVSTTTGGILIAGASYNTTRPNAGINPATLYFACSNSADKITWVGAR